MYTDQQLLLTDDTNPNETRDDRDWDMHFQVMALGDAIAEVDPEKLVGEEWCQTGEYYPEARHLIALHHAGVVLDQAVISRLWCYYFGYVANNYEVVKSEAQWQQLVQVINCNLPS